MSPALCFRAFSSSLIDEERSIRMYKSRGRSRSGVTVTESVCGSPIEGRRRAWIYSSHRVKRKVSKYLLCPLGVMWLVCQCIVVWISSMELFTANFFPSKRKQVHVINNQCTLKDNELLLHLLDKTPQLLFISWPVFVWLLFERGD